MNDGGPVFVLHRSVPRADWPTPGSEDGGRCADSRIRVENATGPDKPTSGYWDLIEDRIRAEPGRKSCKLPARRTSVCRLEWLIPLTGEKINARYPAANSVEWSNPIGCRNARHFVGAKNVVCSLYTRPNVVVAVFFLLLFFLSEFDFNINADLPAVFTFLFSYFSIPCKERFLLPPHAQVNPDLC